MIEIAGLFLCHQMASEENGHDWSSAHMHEQRNLGSWPFLNSRFCVMLAAQLERIKGHEDIDSGEERDNTGSRGDGLLSGWAHPLA
jgi:hypothetical protein